VYLDYVVSWNERAAVRNLGFPQLPTRNFSKLDLLQSLEVKLFSDNPLPYYTPTPHLREEELKKMSKGIIGCSPLLSAPTSESSLLPPDTGAALPAESEDVLAAAGLLALQEPLTAAQADDIDKYQALVQARYAAGGQAAGGGVVVSRRPRSHMSTARVQGGASLVPEGSQVPRKLFYHEEFELLCDVFEECIVRKGSKQVADYDRLEQLYNGRVAQALTANPGLKTLSPKSAK